MSIIGHTPGGSPIYAATAAAAHKSRNSNPRFACSDPACPHSTTKNQAKNTGGLCHQCHAPLKGFVAPKPAAPAIPATLTPAQMRDACLSYRHDFGLLSEDEQARVLFQAGEWWRCFARTLTDPPAHLRG